MKSDQDQRALQSEAREEERLAKLFNKCIELMNAFYRQKHALIPCKINQ